MSRRAPKHADLLGLGVEVDNEEDADSEPDVEVATPPITTTAVKSTGRNDSKEYNGFATIAFESEEQQPEGDQGGRFFDVFAAGDSADHYEVAFERGPIGLQLEADYYGTCACVRGFTTGSDGLEPPAQSCGRIHLGDVLTHINAECVLDVPFEHTLERLQAVQDGPFRLKLRGRGAGGRRSSSNVYADSGITEARRAIFEAKARFFLVPRTEDEMIYCRSVLQYEESLCVYSAWC
jgi:hypothetical protein